MMRRMGCDLARPKTARRLTIKAARRGSQYQCGRIRRVSGPQAEGRNPLDTLMEHLAVERLAEDASTLDSVADRACGRQIAQPPALAQP